MSTSFIPLNGIDFIEYTSPQPSKLQTLFEQLGFVHIATHKNKDVLVYQQGYCRFIINKQKNSFAENFMKTHQGLSICSVGLRIKNMQAEQALKQLTSLGAKPVEADSYSHSFPAIYGVGDSAIYLIEAQEAKNSYLEKDFTIHNQAPQQAYLISIDHLTHNVPVGQMDVWCEFYSKLFGFTQRRYFDIKGLKTGLISKVMQSPCNTVSIPINEPSKDQGGKKSQIQEYLDTYKGSGIQHLAFSTKNIVQAIDHLKQQGLNFLDIPSTYYDQLKKRLPIIKQDIQDLKRLQILADGDDKLYLLQIFTENQQGPIFFEVIERHGHQGFGEGNFQALFDAIERDQIKRGYL